MRQVASHCAKFGMGGMLPMNIGELIVETSSDSPRRSSIKPKSHNSTQRWSAGPAKDPPLYPPFSPGSMPPCLDDDRAENVHSDGSKSGRRVHLRAIALPGGAECAISRRTHFENRLQADILRRPALH